VTILAALCGPGRGPWADPERLQLGFEDLPRWGLMQGCRWARDRPWAWSERPYQNADAQVGQLMF